MQANDLMQKFMVANIIEDLQGVSRGRHSPLMALKTIQDRFDLLLVHNSVDAINIIFNCAQ